MQRLRTGPRHAAYDYRNRLTGSLWSTLSMVTMVTQLSGSDVSAVYGLGSHAFHLPHRR